MNLPDSSLLDEFLEHSVSHEDLGGQLKTSAVGDSDTTLLDHIDVSVAVSAVSSDGRVELAVLVLDDSELLISERRLFRLQRRTVCR